MPANKNAMTRYALIDKMLANRHNAYSIQDITNVLAEKLPEFGQEPVSKRCVEKDINYIEYDFPINVEIEEYYIDASDINGKSYKKRCIRYADPTFSIFKPQITDDEKNILSTALNTLGSFDGLENFEWLDDLKKRLDLVEHTPVIHLSKNIHSNSQLIARLFTAIKNKIVITLKYHTFKKPTNKYVDISPYILKEYNNRWYLICSACDSRKILNFALDRIDGFSPNYSLNYQEAPNDFLELYEEIIGPTYIKSKKLHKIIFWASDEASKYIDTKPIHSSKTTIHNDKQLRLEHSHLQGGTFYYIKCRENYELIRELCSFGAELVVISPFEIQQKVFKRIAEMYNIYCPKYVLPHSFFLRKRWRR